MQSKELLDAAFRADYDRNGPSLYRLMRTMFARYREYGRDADLRVRARVSRAAEQLQGTYAAALWAIARHDARRHPSGKHLEPRTFFERTNWA